MAETDALIDGAVNALEDAKTADDEEMAHHLWSAVHHIRAAGATDLADNHQIRGWASKRLVTGGSP